MFILYLTKQAQFLFLGTGPACLLLALRLN